MNEAMMDSSLVGSRYPISKEDALRNVYEMGFAVDDIILYLDTHGDEAQALEYYQNAKQAYQAAVSAYESAFGPLMFTEVNANTWSWINSPWPWEGEK